MLKFKELLESSTPVLLEFYSNKSLACIKMNLVLQDVALAIGTKGKVVKINLEKNEKLAEVLQINGFPTLMICNKGDVVWRKNGIQDYETLKGLMFQFF